MTIETSRGPAQVVLPCSSMDLLQIVSVGWDRRELVAFLMSHNPSLLLFGLQAFRDSRGRPARSLKRLSRWWQQHGESLFQNLPDGWSDNQVLNDREWRALQKMASRFRKVTDNAAARKLLRKWASKLGSLEKSAAREWVDDILCPRFKFTGKRISKNRPRALRSSKEVASDFSFPIDLESILRWRQAYEAEQQDFERQLLAEKLESLKQLAYGASHEINNPLANISARAQTLLIDESDPERRHKLGVIYEQAMRAHEMISDLMLFAKPPRPVFQPTDIRLFLAGLVNEVGPLLARNPSNSLSIAVEPITIEVRLGPEISTVSMDANQVAVALHALIRNSAEALRTVNYPDGHMDGQIVLRVRIARPGWVEFSVSDRGPGIPRDVRRNMFDPFYSGREAGRGLGFGLSKAWRIACEHGGSLQLDESADDQTRFLFCIPVAPAMTGRIDNSSAA